MAPETTPQLIKSLTQLIDQAEKLLPKPQSDKIKEEAVQTLVIRLNQKHANPTIRPRSPQR